VADTDELVAYIRHGPPDGPPAEALEYAKHHLLDSLAACVSGSRLAAGQAGARLARMNSAPGPAALIGNREMLAPQYAAVANAMAAHADETDDANPFSGTHPGSSIVPVALAHGQSLGKSGLDLLKSMIVGYDVGVRVTIALWAGAEDRTRVSRHTANTGGMFGSAAAAAYLSELGAEDIRVMLSYVAMQFAGIGTWRRDTQHVFKAYSVAGAPAWGGLFALSLVQACWTGIHDVFNGEANIFEVAGVNPNPAELTLDLGKRFEIMRTSIKRFPVGSPNQAPLQAFVDLHAQEQLPPSDITRVVVRIPQRGVRTVNAAGEMPNVNLPYLMHCCITDGNLTFAAAHDRARFDTWRNAGGDPRIVLEGDEAMPHGQANVRVELARGRSYDTHVTSVRGTAGNPMSEYEIRAKAEDLIAPVLGANQARAIIDAVYSLESHESLTNLGQLLQIG
jgi:2-methylcitrate dehydratase PrpD